MKPYRIGPCDILIIGEAPGPIENKFGVPFIGPAGEELDRLLTRAREVYPHNLTIGITNTVVCFPQSETGGFRQPDKDEIRACRSRLLHLIKTTKPLYLVTAGEIAKSSYPKPAVMKVHGLSSLPRKHVTHPSAILRKEDDRDYQIAITKWVSTMVSVLAATNRLKRKS